MEAQPNEYVLEKHRGIIDCIGSNEAIVTLRADDGEPVAIFPCVWDNVLI